MKCCGTGNKGESGGNAIYGLEEFAACLKDVPRQWQAVI